VSGVSFAPGGGRLASASWDRTVRVWDAASGAELLCLRGHEHVVYSIAFSPNGRRLAGGSDDGRVRVWDADSGAELLHLRGHDRLVYRVGFSSDGRRLVSKSADRTERVWDASSGRCLGVTQGRGGQAAADPGEPDLPWQATPSQLETVIESTASGKAVAWFPLALRSLAAHPSGRAWAGASATEVCLFTLEGAGESPSSSQNPGGETAGG
jgi:hypothetical protein